MLSICRRCFDDRNLDYTQSLLSFLASSFLAKRSLPFMFTGLPCPETRLVGLLQNTDHFVAVMSSRWPRTLSPPSCTSLPYFTLCSPRRYLQSKHFGFGVPYPAIESGVRFSLLHFVASTRAPTILDRPPTIPTDFTLLSPPAEPRRTSGARSAHGQRTVNAQSLDISLARVGAVP